jgi:hypothetical protein
MRRQALTFALALAAVGFAAAPVRAQPMMAPGGGGGMPNLARIVGKPLPDAGMAAGTLSVRVARKMPMNAVAGAEVSAVIRNAGGDLRKRTATTDNGGRALFEGLAPGDTVKATVKVDGEELVTDELTMPPTGGLKTMLISGLGGEAPAGAGEGQSQESEGARFMLGATSGNAFPDSTLATGELQVRAFDESGAPIPNHAVVLGMVGKDSKVDVKKTSTDASGVAHFTGLPVGDGTGYAAVVEWHGMRLGTTPFAMPAEGGARAEIRALARTSDPKVVTIGVGARIIVFMHEDRLVVRELLPLENTSDKMFDPTPGALEIPLPSGHVGTEVIEGERKVDVRKDHGIAVHGAIPPKSSVLTTSGRDTGNDVEFLFALPYDSDTRDVEQPVPNGMGAFTLIIQQIEGLDIRVTGPGVSEREERTLNGKKYWVMGVQGAPAGGMMRFTLHGLPSTDSSGRIVAGGLALLLIVGAIALGRRPRSAAGPSGRPSEDERSRLVDRREALFSSLVALEQEARAAGTAPPAERRKQLVTELEQVYRRLAAQDEQRAA